MRILILIFLLALSITANAECEVNGYYRADGTWVNGYTRSGDCWNGKVIGYDAQGRTAEERRAIQVKQNRIIIPFILLLIFLLGTWSEKVAENSRLRILINIIIYPAALYLLYMIILDPLALIVILFGLFVWNWIASRKEKKKSKQISEKKKTYLSTTAISDINNITNKFHLFDHLVKHNLIYRQNNSYKLTEIGIDIGGEYRSNKNGLQWIVWKKNCLDSYIADLKNNLLNTSTKTENLKRNKLKQTTCNSSEIVVEGNTINLGKELNLEFISAKDALSTEGHSIISRQLAIELYVAGGKKLIYNDESFTVFTTGEFGVLINKYNNVANECWFFPKQGAIALANKEDLSEFFYAAPTDLDDQYEYDDDDDDDISVNGKVYLSDGVWIDKKDKWW